MARMVRLEYANALYHVVSRGDRAQVIFHDDADRGLFLESLGQCCGRTGWRVHAFVLMPNHFHLLIETPQANLVAGMKWLLGAYAIRHNARHQIHGHLFAGRYRAQLVSPSPGYAEAVADYIHLNPARAKLLSPSQPLPSYPWSSLRHFVRSEERRPDWLVTDRVPDGGGPEPIPGVSGLEARLERCRRDGAEPAGFKDIRRGWCFGEPAFRTQRLGELAAKAGPSHSGPELAAAAEMRAENLVRTALSQWSWTAKDLQSAPKGHPRKLELALRLRTETSMTIRWIAERLCMGTAGHLSHLLYWQRRGERPPKPVRVRKSHRPARSRPADAPSPSLGVPERPSSPEPEPAADGVASITFDPTFD